MKIFETTSEDIIIEEVKEAWEKGTALSAEELDAIELSPLDDEAMPHSGFAGNVFVYDEEIFINTVTGEGFDPVIRKMKAYIDWYSGKVRLSGFEREDIKQQIVLIMLDGMRRYNPDHKIKLSTFLYIHVKNRMISRIKEDNRQSLNATFYESLFKFSCTCGFSVTASKADSESIICLSCNKKVDETWKIRTERFEPMSLDSLISTSTDPDSDGPNDSYRGYRVNGHGKQNNLLAFFSQTDTLELVDKKLDFNSVFSSEDPKTIKIAELMYYDDFSITDAAEAVGLTCWAASLRLKKLKDKKHIKEWFLNK